MAKKAATVLRVKADSVDCPHCGASQDGWLKDTRGTEDTCEDCGEDFYIADNAKLEMTP